MRLILEKNDVFVARRLEKWIAFIIIGRKQAEENVFVIFLFFFYLVELGCHWFLNQALIKLTGHPQNHLEVQE
jgi:hypothetical protein